MLICAKCREPLTYGYWTELDKDICTHRYDIWVGHYDFFNETNKEKYPCQGYNYLTDEFDDVPYEFVDNQCISSPCDC